MSSKKIYITLGFDVEVAEKILSSAQRNQRSRSFIVESILREYFAMPWSGSEKADQKSANKT